MKCAVRMLKKDWEPNTIDFSFGRFEKNTVAFRRKDALPNFTLSSSVSPKIEGSPNAHPSHCPVPCAKTPATRTRTPQATGGLFISETPSTDC